MRLYGKGRRLRKAADVANIQDALTKELIGLACAVGGKAPSPEAVRIMLEGLFATITNVNFDGASLKTFIDRAKAERTKADPLMQLDCEESQVPLKLWSADEDIRSLKSLILFGLRGMAAYAYHALVLGYRDDEVNKMLFTGLAAVGNPDTTKDDLLPVVMDVGTVNLKCMELLDRANTETYGTPVPTTVPLTIEKGPFIVITGHDLYDLQQLLEQTKDKGVNVYTHGEMLPAHAYPKLKAYPQLKGNFGTAWQNQQKEFAAIPAPSCSPPTASCLRRTATATACSPPKSSRTPESYTSVKTRTFRL